MGVCVSRDRDAAGRNTGAQAKSTAIEEALCVVDTTCDRPLPPPLQDSTLRTVACQSERSDDDGVRLASGVLSTLDDDDDGDPRTRSDQFQFHLRGFASLSHLSHVTDGTPSRDFGRCDRDVSSDCHSAAPPSLAGFIVPHHGEALPSSRHHGGGTSRCSSCHDDLHPYDDGNHRVTNLAFSGTSCLSSGGRSQHGALPCSLASLQSNRCLVETTSLWSDEEQNQTSEQLILTFPTFHVCK